MVVLEMVKAERGFAFDEFQLDSHSGELRGPSGEIPLTPKALALLQYLAARPGKLVTKHELLEVLWPNVFVADGALKVCIRQIRRALEDDPQVPRFIETIKSYLGDA